MSAKTAKTLIVLRQQGEPCLLFQTESKATEGPRISAIGKLSRKALDEDWVFCPGTLMFGGLTISELSQISNRMSQP